MHPSSLRGPLRPLPTHTQGREHAQYPPMPQPPSTLHPPPRPWAVLSIRGGKVDLMLWARAVISSDTLAPGSKENRGRRSRKQRPEQLFIIRSSFLLTSTRLTHFFSMFFSFFNLGVKLRPGQAIYCPVGFTASCSVSTRSNLRSGFF